MSARVGKGPIGVRPQRGIGWYRPQSIRMSIEDRGKKRADISRGTGRAPLESGRASWESARVRKHFIGIGSLRGNE